MAISIEDNEVTITQYIQQVIAHWRVIATIIGAAATVAGLYSMLATGQVYTARSSFITTGELAAAPTLEGLVQELTLNLVQTAVKPEVAVCQAILNSRTVREGLVKEYDLATMWGVASEEAAIHALGDQTKIEVQKPNVLEITVTLSGLPWVIARGGKNDRVRQLTAALANSYINALQDKLATFHLSAAKRKRVFLKDKVAESLAQLRSAEQALQGWESSNKLINAEEASRLATQGVVNLQQQQEQAQLELPTIYREITKAKQLLDQQPQMQIASLEQEANPLILSLREKLIQLQADLAMATEVKGETQFHPEVEDIQHQIRTTKQALAEQQRQQMFTARQVETHNPAVDKLLEKLLLLLIKREAVAARSEGLKRAIAEAEKGIMGLSVQAMEYGRLLRDVKVREAVYRAVVNEYEQARIAEQADEPQVYILDEAVAPEGASAPRVGVNMALAAFVAMIVGILWAMSQPVPGDSGLVSSTSQEVGEDQAKH